MQRVSVFSKVLLVLLCSVTQILGRWSDMGCSFGFVALDHLDSHLDQADPESVAYTLPASF